MEEAKTLCRRRDINSARFAGFLDPAWWSAWGGFPAEGGVRLRSGRLRHADDVVLAATEAKGHSRRFCSVELLQLPHHRWSFALKDTIVAVVSGLFIVLLPEPSHGEALFRTGACG